MNTQKNEYQVLGMMSGTSLDGLDLAHCTFRWEAGAWQYSINQALTLEYPETWQNSLRQAIHLDGEALSRLHVDYGAYLGEQAKIFLQTHKLDVDFISSHGHTVFHQPEHRLTTQIGSGWEIFAKTSTKVIADFRSKDLALGGQGAPLVPVGDRHLFAAYEFCLNLGGIANVSTAWSEERIAFDICPANMLLNFLVKDLGLRYDAGGDIARSGKTDHKLLQQLNALHYYQESPPKSMGWEWFDREVIPLIQGSTLETADKLRTSVMHIARQIADALEPYVVHTKAYQLLVSGGGAKNTFLIEQIQDCLPAGVTLVVPEDTLIDFKEALVFAFLGVLRDRGEVNCLASVTGALYDHSAGLVFE